MKFTIFLLTIFTQSTFLFAQSDNRIDFSSDWESKILSSEYLDPNDITKEFIQYDFSKLWISRSTNLFNEIYNSNFGYLGNKYQRIRIRIISVTKNKNNRDEYIVFGKSKVKDNICDFIGTIKIKTIRKYKWFELPETISGILISEYRFFENPNQKHSGIFSGISTVNWYKDKRENIFYDDVNVDADGYHNNEFVGTWESYGGDLKLKCIWGDYRIPFSDELDIGTGLFHPNEKYKMNGWESYLKALKGDSTSVVEENSWWK